MVIARIKCGLGNQLFQYAAATALATRLGTSAACDLRWFDGANSKRQRRDRRAYLLPTLGLTLPEVSPATTDAFAPSWWRRWLGARPTGTRVTQDHRPMLEELRRTTGDVLLEGYWQGEPFFVEARSALASHLTALSPRSADSARGIDMLAEPGTAALHIRRGDYAHARGPNALLGTLDVAYYRSALATLGASKAVVFTDDVSWCTEHFRPGVPITCVSRPTVEDTSVDDLLTIGHARAVVIANSTFSWWGAWIASQRGARVVAPAPWFRDRSYAAWEPLLQVPGWIWLDRAPC